MREAFPLMLVALLALAGPSLALAALGYPAVGLLAGLLALGAAIVTFSAGWRVGIAAALFSGILVLLSVTAAGITSLAVITMAAIAIVFGSLARFGLQQSFTMYPIAMGFVVTEKPTDGSTAALVAFASIVVVSSLIIVGFVSFTTRRDPQLGHRPKVKLSYRRTYTYVALLTLATVVASSIALVNNWGHTGGWLIMTVFIVIQPYVQDSWRKSVQRAAGTFGGFLLALVLYWMVGQSVALTVFGVIFALLAIWAIVKKLPYWLYAMWLTPGVVILESVGRPLQQTADSRLAATLLGIVISLVVMAIAYPIYRWSAHRQGLDHY
jgi:hypothetical protein